MRHGKDYAAVLRELGIDVERHGNYYPDESWAEAGRPDQIRKLPAAAAEKLVDLSTAAARASADRTAAVAKAQGEYPVARHRWVVERTLAWLHRFRRLAVRYERRSDIHAAFLRAHLVQVHRTFLLVVFRAPPRA